MFGARGCVRYTELEKRGMLDGKHALYALKLLRSYEEEEVYLRVHLVSYLNTQHNHMMNELLTKFPTNRVV